jgi:Tfp pilus assembly protein PilN
VLVANPAHLTTARLFSLPSIDPKEIRDIVQLQAEKHTPYAKEEILTDFAVLDVDRAGYSRVLLAIAHQDVIYRALRVVEAMGWPLERVGLELEGLVSWFGQVRPSASQPTAVVAVDQEISTLVIIHQHKPYFHRSIPVGAAQVLEQPKEAPARFLSELQRSLDALEAEGLNLAVSEIVLTGMTGSVQEFLPSWQETLKLPLSLVPAGQGFLLPTLPQGDEQDPPWIACASLLGLALDPGAVDLTPAPLKLHRAVELRAGRLMQVGAQIMAVLILGCVLVLGHVQRDERYRTQLRAEARQVGASADELQRQLTEVELLREWAAVQGQCLDAFTEVVRYSPPEVRWDDLDFRQNDRLVLKGTSTELSKVYDLVAALQRTGMFAQVEARRVAKKRQGDQDVSSFEMVCQLGPPAPAAAAEAT